MSSFEFETSLSSKEKKSKKSSKHNREIDGEAQNLKKLKHRASEPVQGSSGLSNTFNLQQFLNSSNKINDFLNKSRKLSLAANESSHLVEPKDNSEDDNESELNKNNSLNSTNKIKVKKLELISDSESEKEVDTIIKRKHQKKNHSSIKHDVSISSPESVKKKLKNRDKKSVAAGIDVIEAEPHIKSNCDPSFSDEPFIEEKKKQKFHNMEKCYERLENFHSENKSLNVIHYENEALNKLDINSPIFLLELPTHLDPHALIGQSISLNKKTKLTVGDCKYKSITSQQNDDSIVVFANQHNIRLQPTRIVRMELSSESKSSEAFTVSEKVVLQTEVGAPVGLKRRNPVSGLHCDDDPLSAITKKKLRAAVKQYKKSKKQKHEEPVKVEDTSNLEGEEIFKYLSHGATNFGSDLIAQKKHKKLEDETNTILNELLESNKHKTKKHKKNF